MAKLISVFYCRQLYGSYETVHQSQPISSGMSQLIGWILRILRYQLLELLDTSFIPSLFLLSTKGTEELVTVNSEMGVAAIKF